MRASLWLRVLIAVLATLCMAVPVAVAQQDLSIVLQGVDDSAYPTLSLTVLLPRELLPDGGEEPTFALKENGSEISGIEAVSLRQERDPVDVVLLVDASGSMKGAPLDHARTAAHRFVDAMGSQDRIAVVAFSSEPAELADFTADRTSIANAVDSLSAAGETALWDGIVKATDVLSASTAGKRYIVVLSDGGDTTSINTFDKALAALKKSGVPLYAVALESPEYDPQPLNQLATQSAGRLVSVADAAQLTTIYQDIAEELQNAYRVSYTSAGPNTRDLDLELVGARGIERGTLRQVITNPLFDIQGQTAEDSTLLVPQPRASYRAAALGLGFLFVALLAGVLGFMMLPEHAALDQLRHYEQFQTSQQGVEGSGSHMGGARGRVMEAVSVVAEQRGFTGLLRTKLERAGLPLRPNEYMYFHVLTTILAGFIVSVVFRNAFLSFAAILLVVAVPLMLLEIAITRRRSSFEEQLPDVLNLIAGSLRAGWGVQQSIDLVVQEITDPAAMEFRRVQSESRLGLPLEEALGRMAERVDSDDFRWTVAAISIQRDVGGDLAEVLDIVAKTIRERAELRRHVSALTAESRFSAIVLVILPFFMFFAMLVVNPQYMSGLFASVIGIGMLVLGIVMLLIGTFWLTRLTQVDV